MASSRLSTFIALVSVVSLSALSAWPAGAAEYDIHVVDPPVTNHVVLTEGPLPPVCKPARTVELAGCRGQALPMSFVVSATKPLEKVRIEAGPVRGEAGDWPTRAVDVRVVKEYWHGVSGAPAGPLPTLLVHDDQFLAIEPDPTEENPNHMTHVARGPLRDSKTLRPVDVHKRTQFWVTVQIPEKAKPGRYETTLLIVPGNCGAKELSLSISVHPFDLMAPMIEYSIYYPSYLEANMADDAPLKFGDLGAEQMLAEFQNMRAHGLNNPNIFDGPRVNCDGDLDFSKLDRILDLREQAGMRPRTLYMLGHPLPVVDRPLSEEEKARAHRYVPRINGWAQSRGYDQVFFATADEWWGERLSRERDSMRAIGEAGGATYVAVMHPTFFQRVGDALTRPVLMAQIGAHLEKFAQDYTTAQDAMRNMDAIGKGGLYTRVANQAKMREAIDGMHRQGRKIFTYMNPTAGVPLPELHRRNTGLGMWRIGYDGTMTWAYTHNSGDKVNQAMHFAMVYRTENGVLDTLHWEGFREGVYDVQYLTTLLARLAEAKGRFPDEPLVADTWSWLDRIDAAEGDLAAVRGEMAERIVALQGLGYRRLGPDEMFAGVDLDEIRLTTMPEPWRFRPDPDDEGVKGQWFDPAIDIAQWAPLRTDIEQGWETQGFREQAVGHGWYRTLLPTTPDDVAKKHKYLFFGAVDEDCWVYLNGQMIFNHSYETTGLVPAQIWMTPFSVDLTEVVVNGRDALAVRVKNQGSMAGIWKPVQFVATNQALTPQQVEALVKSRKPESTP